MLKNSKVTKDDILNAAFTIIKNNGIDDLTVRKISSKLGCSVQPIYYKFGNIDELKRAVWNKIIDTYQSYMYSNLDGILPYKQLGLNYIRFAKEEPKLFQMIFMSKTDLTIDKFITQDKSFDSVKRCLFLSTGLENKQAEIYHKKMWIFTHGIACLVATSSCKFTDEEIGSMLTDEYKALNLLETERKDKNE